MKKLELTESSVFIGKIHADMLIEMCKHLIGDCYLNADGTIGVVKGRFDAIDIPWIEVCLLHLPKALANSNNRAWDIAIRQTYHLHEFYHHPKHPVDYLYQEYQDHIAWNKLK